MKNRMLLTTAIISCLMFNITNAQGAVQNAEDDYMPSASKSELGQEQMNIDYDFNLRAVQEAFNKSKSTANIQNIYYDKDITYKIRMRLSMGTSIIFPKNVNVYDWVLADDHNFEVKVFADRSNILVLSAVSAGVDTNLTVFDDNGNTYSFYLRNDPIDSKIVPDLVVYVHGVQPSIHTKADEEKKPKKARQATRKPLSLLELEKSKTDYLKTLPEGKNYNLDYSIRGDEEIAPKAVFDDGEGFTYFDFREGLPSDRLPIVSKVIDGKDARVNTRYEDGFLIAESMNLGGSWTLRNGAKVACVESLK